MSVYDPWAPDAEDRIRLTHQQEYKVTVYPATGAPFTLDPDPDAGGVSLVMDEAWQTHIMAQLSCRIPDAAQLAALDPRTRCRLVIEAGYVHGGGIRDVHTVADLQLRSRPVKRPDNTLALTASSDESAAVDYLFSAVPALNLSGVNEFLTSVLALAVPGAVIVSDFPAAYGAAGLAGLAAGIGDEAGKLILDGAARAGVWIHCTADRKWRIRSRAALATATSCQLFTGPAGTVTTSESGLERELWANDVLLKYRTAAGADVWGHAYISAGPYSVASSGRKTYKEERNTVNTVPGANAAAAQVLANVASRGRSVTVEAVAAYWLRPGDTVTVQLPTGEQERHLVQTISFYLDSGRMKVKTRLPEPFTITQGA